MLNDGEKEKGDREVEGEGRSRMWGDRIDSV